MSALINFSINVAKLPKEKFIAGKDGAVYVNLTMSVKAIASKGAANIETFGSALKGDTYKNSTTNSFYIAEMAEKRAMSRAVLKLTGFYELGVFGEDESESFKRK